MTNNFREKLRMKASPAIHRTTVSLSVLVMDCISMQHGSRQDQASFSERTRTAVTMKRASVWQFAGKWSSPNAVRINFRCVMYSSGLVACPGRQRHQDHRASACFCRSQAAPARDCMLASRSNSAKGSRSEAGLNAFPRNPWTPPARPEQQAQQLMMIIMLSIGQPLQTLLDSASKSTLR